jgi:hypothetical protein
MSGFVALTSSDRMQLGSAELVRSTGEATTRLWSTMSISNIQESSPDVREGRFSRTSFLRFCGWAAILGVVSAALANLIASGIVEDYSMVSQSISALAAGERSWIQDLGLYILAVGIAALALGLGAWQSHHRSWMMGVAALSLIALDIVAIGFFHGYAKEDVSGTHLHTYAVYALGLLFAATASLAGISLRRSEKRVSVFSFVIWFLWILSAPFFFSVPSSWFGLYERGLGLLLLAWICVMGWLLWNRNREA